MVLSGNPISLPEGDKTYPNAFNKDSDFLDAARKPHFSFSSKWKCTGWSLRYTKIIAQKHHGWKQFRNSLASNRLRKFNKVTIQPWRGFEGNSKVKKAPPHPLTRSLLCKPGATAICGADIQGREVPQCRASDQRDACVIRKRFEKSEMSVPNR